MTQDYTDPRSDLYDADELGTLSAIAVFKAGLTLDDLLRRRVDWGVMRELWSKRHIAGDADLIGHCSRFLATPAGRAALSDLNRARAEALKDLP